MEEKYEKMEALKGVKELITFPEDDIRSRAKLFDYAFEGGKFSSDKDAYPNCQGVVGWINPDINAPEREKIYVVLPEQINVPYAIRYCETEIDNSLDGRGNTQKLIAYGKIHKVQFPAAEYADNYTKNGLKKGETFWPAQEQLARVCVNGEIIHKTLKIINGTFDGLLWASDEFVYERAWYVNSRNGRANYNYKDNIYSVSFFISY